MTVTVVGQVADQLGHASQVAVVSSADPGRPFDVEHRARSFSSLEYRAVQPASVWVDVEHQGLPVGSVRYLERTAGGSLFGVCEVDASEVGSGPWFFSPEILHDVQGGDIELAGLALTRSPASVALQAVTAFPGSLREAIGSGHCGHDLAGGLVRRANEYDKRRRAGDPIDVADLARSARWNQLVGRSAHDPAVAAEYRMLADEEASRRQPIRHGPPGRILSVR